MENENSKHYIDLAELLKKERSECTALKVNKVLASDMPVHEKIDAIRKIDSISTSTEPNFRKNSKTESEAEVNLKRDFTNIRQSHYERQYLKQRIVKQNFLSFLFNDFLKIIKFSKSIGNKDDVIKYRFLPPSIKVNRRITTVFQNSFQRYSDTLLPILDKIQKVGWRHLGKKEYNEIVQFKGLCKSISSLNLKIFMKKRDDVILKMRSLENYYMVCTYDSSYPVMIAKNIRMISEKYPEWSVNAHQLENYTKLILSKTGLKPSLANILLSFNMIYYRRFLNFNDLFSKSNLNVIPDYEYECSQEIGEKIAKYVIQQKEELFSYIEEKRDIEKFEKFIPVDENGNYDISLLEHYYSKTKIPGKSSFLADKIIIPLLVRNCSYIFLKNFEQLLCGKISIKGKGKQAIFENAIFQWETSKIKILSEQLERLSYDFKNIDRERFITLLNNNKSGTESEMEIMNTIQEILTIFQTTANRLVEIDRHSINTSENGKNLPVLISDINNKNIQIPYKSEPIDSIDLLNSMTVSNAIHDAIMLCLIISVYLNDSYISRLMKRKSTIMREIRLRKENLQRTAKPDDYINTMKKADLSL